MTAKTNPVNWFEIPTSDLNRAKGFYESVFDCQLSLQKMGPLQMAWFPMVEGGTGATGTLIKAESYTSSHSGTLVYFPVSNMDLTLKKVTANGGKILNPKMSIGEHGFVAHFEDSEGNRVALHSTS